jgi:hypothetical protein
MSGLPHGQGLAQFSFVAVKPPDHKLTIMVFDKETAAPSLCGGRVRKNRKYANF